MAADGGHVDPEQLAGFLLLAVTPAHGYALDQQEASEYHLVLADKRKQAILSNQQGCAKHRGADVQRPCYPKLKCRSTASAAALLVWAWLLRHTSSLQ